MSDFKPDLAGETTLCYSTKLASDRQYYVDFYVFISKKYAMSKNQCHYFQNTMGKNRKSPYFPFLTPLRVLLASLEKIKQAVCNSSV